MKGTSKKKKTIKAIIWDNGGVLSNNVGGSFAHETAKLWEAPLEDVIRILTSHECDLLNMGKMSDDEFRNFVIQEIGLPEEKKRLILNASIDDFYYDKELHDYIRIQQRNYITALLSVMPLQFQETIRTGWPEFEEVFDHIIVSCEVHLLKPDPKIYQLTLDRIGCKAEEAVFIDDLEENVIAAGKMGIESILFMNREQAIGELEDILAAN